MQYTSPTKKMDHQREASLRLARRPKRPSPSDVMAWIMDTGTGKSKVVLDEWQERLSEGEGIDLFVVAPAGSYQNWFEDKADDQPSELRAHLDPRLLAKVVVGPWGPGAKYKRMLRVCLDERSEPRALFMNVEALSSGGRAEAAAREFLTAMPERKILFVVDESTAIKATRAQRTKAIMRLRDVAGDARTARRIMSGLVTPKSPLDLFAQFEFLDWRILGFESPIAFRNRYAKIERQCFLPSEMLRNKLRPRYRGEDKSDVDRMSRSMLLEELERLRVWVQQVPIIKGYQNVDELQKKIAPYSYCVMKEECLDLKGKIYVPRHVGLTSDQERLYADMRDNCTAEIEAEKHVTAPAVITQMMRLHQILCGFTTDDDGVVHDVKTNRDDELMSVIDDHSGKVVVWTWYRRQLAKTAAALRKEYGDDSVAEFHGGNKHTRVDDERRFLGDPKCRFMLASQGAGGRGNTWTNAHLEVYASSTHDLELRYQSEDRCYRKGQKHAVTIVDLLARGTVEEKILRCLRGKIDLASAVTGKNYGQWLV